MIKCHKYQEFQKSVLLFICVICIPLHSCEVDPDVIDPDEVNVWKYYNTSNGLTHNEIKVIHEDRSGSVWVGTNGGGLCKFDDGNWSYIHSGHGLLDNRILSIAEDGDGDLWIGTGYGISIITDDGIVNPDLFMGYFLPVSLYCDNKGRMWIGSTIGIFLYQSGYLSHFDSANEDFNTIYCITEDNTGRIWFATRGGALYYVNGSFYSKTSDDGLYVDNVHYIFQDSWGDIWFGHLSADRVTRWDGNNFDYINLYNGYTTSSITSIVEDQNHNIWFTIVESGVVQYDGVIPHAIGLNSGLKDDFMLSTEVTSDGNIWFGSESAGIHIYTPE